VAREGERTRSTTPYEELEIKEREISMQFKVKELEIATAAARPTNTTEEFDVTRHIRFVSPFLLYKYFFAF